MASGHSRGSGDRRRRSEYEEDGFVDGDADPAPSRGGYAEDAAGDEDDAPRRRPRAAAAAAGPGGRRRIEFEDDDEDTEPRRAKRRRRIEEDDDEEYEERRPRRRPERRPAARQNLVNICTPVFAYAAMLPREGGAQIQPPYQQFRQQVLAALQRIEVLAPENDIDRDDAQEAAYAMSMFMDEQVATSDWVSAGQWMQEPLWRTLHNDPDGGVNFFRRLDELGNRQKEVKAVYLACLSLGYLGRYADVPDAAQRTAQIGEIRQRLIREIHPAPMEKLRHYFPEAYAKAEPIEVEVPPPPRWWWIASISTVVVCLLIWLFLIWYASRIPEGSSERVRQKIDISNVTTPTTRTGVRPC